MLRHLLHRPTHRTRPHTRNFAGHNKWSKIRHKKGANDAARSKVVTKMVRSLAAAVREAKQKSIANVESDYKVQQAKAAALRAGCTKANVERALKPPAKDDNSVWERILYECTLSEYCFIVECLSDNRKRTGPLVKFALTKHGGSMGTTGSVMWAFDERGIVEIAPSGVDESENDEMISADGDLDLFDAMFVGAVDAGAEDVEMTEEGTIVVLSDPSLLSTVTTAVREVVAASDGDYNIVQSAFTYLPKSTVVVGEEMNDHDDGDGQGDGNTFMEVLEALEELEDVQNVFHNGEL